MRLIRKEVLEKHTSLKYKYNDLISEILDFRTNCLRLTVHRTPPKKQSWTPILRISGNFELLKVIYICFSKSKTIILDRSSQNIIFINLMIHHRYLNRCQNSLLKLQSLLLSPLCKSSNKNPAESCDRKELSGPCKEIILNYLSMKDETIGSLSLRLICVLDDDINSRYYLPIHKWRHSLKGGG